MYQVSLIPINMKKKYILFSLILILLVVWAGVVVFYSKQQPTPTAQNKLKVVTTLFPTYDFVRQIGGDRVNATLLLPPGVEPHAFEPTPKDIIAINESGVFIYTGKYMEPWVESVLKGVNNQKMIVVDASSHALFLKAEDEDINKEKTNSDGTDPHIWLDLDNSRIMIDDIVVAMATADPTNADYYQNNANIYRQKLTDLDTKFKNGLKNCLYNEFVHGGHYAFGYLAHRYGLKYLSAQGFNPDSEPTPQQLINLSNQVNRLGIKYVYYEELVDPRIARTIAAETSTTLLKINSAHNLSKEELSGGITYERIMEEDLNQLRIGLECR